MDLYSVGEMLVDFCRAVSPEAIFETPGRPCKCGHRRRPERVGGGHVLLCGDDDFGRYLLGTLRENRVRCIRREPAGEAVTTMAFVSLTEEGERSFTFVRKPGADMFLREEDVREADIRDTVIVHAGSCSLSASPSGRGHSQGPAPGSGDGQAGEL